jgi:hypothetical protein
MDRSRLKSIFTRNIDDFTGNIDDFTIDVGNEAKSTIDPHILKSTSKIVSAGMRSQPEEVFTLGGLQFGKVIDNRIISRNTRGVIAGPQESLTHFGHKIGGGFYDAGGDDRALASLLGKKTSNLKFGKNDPYIALSASIFERKGQKMWGSTFTPHTVLHELGHAATDYSSSVGNNHGLTYLPENTPDIIEARTNTYINGIVKRSLEESRANTYAYDKLFQSDKMLKKAGAEDLVFRDPYSSGFRILGEEQVPYHPFKDTYGDYAMNDVLARFGSDPSFDATEAMIRGEIHGNAAMLSTVGLGKGEESQLPRIQQRISDTRLSILEQHGERYASEYDEALSQYGRLGRFSLSADPKLISETKALWPFDYPSTSPVAASPSRVSARIASKEMPQTIEEGVEVATRRSGATRGLLKAASEASSHVASGTGGSRMLRTAGAALSILRKRF